MTFHIQGLNTHEQMPLNKVFKKQVVEKTAAITPVRAIDEDEHRDPTENRSHQQSSAKAYQSISELPQTHEVVVAGQIMSSPVVILSLNAVVADALELFQEKQIRHLPVVSPEGELVGMVSERDALRHLSGITGNYQRASSHHDKNERITTLMNAPVLTASIDTDVRYIARLFVEQRVGALPVVADGELKGMITRSDVLSAVMRHFALELWV